MEYFGSHRPGSGRHGATGFQSGAGGTGGAGEAWLQDLLKQPLHGRDAGEFRNLLQQPLHDPDRDLKQMLKDTVFNPSDRRPRPGFRIPSVPYRQIGKLIGVPARLNPYLRAADAAKTLLELMLMSRGTPDQPAYYDMTGWTQICNDGYDPGKGPAYVNTGVFAPGLSCDRSAVDPPAGEFGETVEQGSDAWPPSAINMRWFAIGQNNDIGPNKRMGRNEQWERTDGLRDPVPFVEAVPGRKPLWRPVEPRPVPFGWRPEFDKPGKPYGFPDPTPFRLIPQWRESPAPAPEKTTKPSPGPERAPIVNPGPVPGKQIEVTPETKPEHELQPPPPHRPVREREGKERKWRVPMNHPLQQFWGTLTEAGDLIDALYDALPCEARGGKRIKVAAGGGGGRVPGVPTATFSFKGKGPKTVEVCAFAPKLLMHEKVELILRNLDKIDMTEAFKNVIANQIEDFVLGKAGKLANDAVVKSGYWTSPMGIGAGPAF